MFYILAVDPKSRPNQPRLLFFHSWPARDPVFDTLRHATKLTQSDATRWLRRLHNAGIQSWIQPIDLYNKEMTK